MFIGQSELKTLEWWISRLMLDPLDPLFFLIIIKVYKIQPIKVAHMKPVNFEILRAI